MRLVVGLVALFLAVAPSAHAGTAADKLPFAVVRVLPETRQALVYDRGRKTHVLVEPGAWIGGYFVVAIEDMDIIVEANRERVTVYPPEAEKIATGSLTGVRLPVGPMPPPAREPMPVDPYAGDPQPVDPYASQGGPVPVDPYR